MPSLLTSVAQLCCITPEELDQYTQVLPPCCLIVSMACLGGTASASCLPAEHRVCQVHCMVLRVLVALRVVQSVMGGSTALSCLCDRALLSCGTAA